jgi:hypothetical protein
MYKKVTVEEYWELIANGYDYQRHTFLLLEDGTQSWGYPKYLGNKTGFFDHHRQGSVFSHKNKIKYVLVDLDKI